MLFQRLYNWIKYKTLPPSVLFKNRLFIERDSKHKRIMNNFGLVFRNSKWTNYENYNIKVQFRLSFYKFIALFLFVAVTALFLNNFNSLYLFFYFFNSVAYLFWLSFDALDYYLSFLIWLATVSISLFSNIIYSYFFFNNFSQNYNFKKVFSHSFFNNVQILSTPLPNTISKSKHDFNWIFYFWLNNNKIQNNSILESLFSSTQNQQNWKQFSDFFPQLYKLTHLCSLITSKNSIFELSNLYKRISYSSYKNNHTTLISILNLYSPNLQKYNKIHMYYFLFNAENYFQKTFESYKKTLFMKNNNLYNLQNLQNEFNVNSYLTKTKNGNFFFKDLNYGYLRFLVGTFEEFITLNQEVTSQLNSSKWNRWLYRYSITHRKILKNSHKLTLTKKLVNGGFFDTNLFSKNIWASENFVKYDAQSVYSLYNLFYPTSSTTTNWETNFLIKKMNSKAFELSKFHENSYFWFLKRFYFFNNVSSNVIKNKKNINQVAKYEFSPYNESILKYNKELSSFLKSYSLLNSDTTSSFILLEQNEKLTFNVDKLFYNQKDLFTLFQENNILNKNSLDIVYWISGSTSSNNTLPFFNYIGQIDNSISFDEFYFESTKNLPFPFIHKNENDYLTELLLNSYFNK